MRFLPQTGPTDLSFPQEEIQIITGQQLSGKTPACISLVVIMRGDPRESSCGSAGCSAVAGHAAEVQVFQKTKDVQHDSPTSNANLQLVQGGEMSSSEANLCPEIFFLTSNFYLSHLSSPAVTKLGLPLKQVMLLDDYIDVCNYHSVFSSRCSRSCCCFLIGSSKNYTIPEERQGLLVYTSYKEEQVNMLPKNVSFQRSNHMTK